jgi:hypothetical protein
MAAAMVVRDWELAMGLAEYIVHQVSHVIEAPWLVNSGHGASLRHHNDPPGEGLGDGRGLSWLGCQFCGEDGTPTFERSYDMCS